MEQLRVSRQFLISLFFIIILAILVVPPSDIFSLKPNSPVHAAVKNGSTSSSAYHESKPSRKYLDNLAVQSIAQLYLKALLNQQYDVMWSLLHRQGQAKGPDERAFSTFLQDRLKEFTLHEFVLGHREEIPHLGSPQEVVEVNPVV